GRVYEWVSPSGGVLQGNYEALRPLVAPNKKQLISFGGRFNINQHESISAEVGLSDHDDNLFSSLDDSDNNGQALKIGFESNSRYLGSENGYKISSNINFEFNSRNFKAIDRFRYIEFDRDWSYNPRSLDPKFEDKILTTSINLQKDVFNNISYKLVGRKKGSLINGLQHYISLKQLFGKLQLSSDAFLMDNKRLNDRSEWKRLNVDISFLMKNVVPGYVYGLDKNVVTDLSDSIINSAMNYTSHTFYLRSPGNAKTKYDARYVYREDNLPLDGEIQLNSRSNTGSFNLSSEVSDKHTLGLQFIYRNLENIADLSPGRNEETISGRIDWLGSMLDNNLRMEVNYTLSNSRELRREFSYLQVPTGEGTHTWRDLNDDGIQDLNEFFLAINTDEQNYVKLFVPTNDFISAFDNLLNYRLNVNFPSKWRGQGGIKEFLSRFSNNTSWTSHHKVVDNNLDARLLPFIVNLEDDDVLSVRETMRSTLFYNRSNPKFGLSLTTFTNKRKQLLTNGFEARNSQGLEFTNRINITRFYNFKITSSRSVNNSSSNFLQGRDFKIRELKLSPVISWQPSAKMRISTTYSISDKRNSSDFETPGNAVINEFSTELRLNNAAKSSLIANFRFIDIEFQGEENTPLGYELLQALRPGSNLTWMVNFQKKLTSGLQLNLTYEGRKSPSVDLVQIGRVQMTALF
ncbi:MAG: hypothetical protein O7F74_02085, partial [Bacteroidetes bacterium]|nr:hypothetical protein [Bacteroidota bacterium]